MNTKMYLERYVLAPVRAARRPLREEDGVAHERRPAQSKEHVSVLQEEVLSYLSPKGGDIIVDATIGEGGHSEGILKCADVRLIGLDADPSATLNSRKKLEPFQNRINIIEANFGDLDNVLGNIHQAVINKALFDLGWNRTQLFSGRGFSFTENESLNMSYGPTPASGFTAEEIVNTWSESALSDIFYGYGEERYSKRIAKQIVATRTTHPYITTNDLVEAVRVSVPSEYRNGRIHPATRTFQALRIAVNSEIPMLERGIRTAWKHLAPCGRIVVISFHSIEDRIVKNLFKEFSITNGHVLTKKPITPQEQELLNNPSSRSAKLRAIEKI